MGWKLSEMKLFCRSAYTRYSAHTRYSDSRDFAAFNPDNSGSVYARVPIMMEMVVGPLTLINGFAFDDGWHCALRTN